ncbi:hypothetical protein LDENG_00215950 [Lucifuga dentata]|nr:hypothetical protein LDENG_00215950 [Lucifuga dentata]
MVIGQTTMSIYIIWKDGADAEEPEDVGFILEAVEVLCNLQSLTLGFNMLFGLIYDLNLNYLEELKCTFKVFQKTLMELDR